MKRTPLNESDIEFLRAVERDPPAGYASTVASDIIKKLAPRFEFEVGNTAYNFAGRETHIQVSVTHGISSTTAILTTGAVRDIHRKMGLWLKDRKPDDGPCMTATETRIRAEAILSAPRRVKFGNLEFYKHLSNCAGGPLVYVSTHGFGRPPMKVGKMYGPDLRALRDWANEMLGEGA